MGFELARNRPQAAVSVDKSNVLTCSRLWREVATDPPYWPKPSSPTSPRSRRPVGKDVAKHILCEQTSNSAGFIASSMAANPHTCAKAVQSRKFASDRGDYFAPQAGTFQHIRFVHRHQPLASISRQLKTHSRDPLNLIFPVAHRVHCLAAAGSPSIERGWPK